MKTPLSRTAGCLRLTLLLFALLAACPGYSQTLRELARAQGKFVGTAINSASTFYGDQSDTAYMRILGSEFNVYAAENEMKFDALHTAPGVFDFTKADRLVNYGVGKGARLRGHSPIWYSQVPNWVNNGNFTRPQLLDVMKNFITTVMTRYRGKIAEYDVVNEAFTDGSSPTLRSGESVWYRTIGADYLDSAFVYARRADPTARLMYNEYAAEDLGPKSEAVYNLVKGLRQRGIPVDGVGFQCHFRLSEMTDQKFRDMDANVKRLGALGLKVSFTELDIRLPLMASAADLQAQRVAYQRMMQLLLDNSAFCDTFVMWGFIDKYSWIESYFPGEGLACIYDKNYRKKPAYFGLFDALNFARNTSLPGRIQAENFVRTRGLTGQPGTDDDQTPVLTGFASLNRSAEYRLTVTRSGAYQFGFRVRGRGVLYGRITGEQYNLPLVVTVNSPDAYRTVVVPLSSTLPAGDHTLVLTGLGNGLALNWLEGQQISADLPGRVLAENYIRQANTNTTNGPEFSRVVTANAPGATLDYLVNVRRAGTYLLNLRVARADTTAARVDVLRNDWTSNLPSLLPFRPLASLTAPGTGDPDQFETVKVRVQLTAGLQTFRLRFAESGTRLAWLEINDYETLPTRVLATNYLSQSGASIRADGDDPAGTPVMTLPTNARLNFRVVSPTAKAYYFQLRARGSGTVEVRRGADVLASFAVTNPGWQSYVRYADLPVDTLALSLMATAGNVEVNWLNLTAYTPVPGVVQAEDFIDQRGVRLLDVPDQDGTTSLAYLQPKDYVEYLLDVKKTGQYVFSYRVTSYVDSSYIEMRRGDTLVHRVFIPRLRGFVNVNAPANLTAGLQTIRLYFPGGDINLNSFEVGDATYYRTLATFLETQKGLPATNYVIGGGTEGAVLNGRQVDNNENNATFTTIDVPGQSFTKALSVNVTAPANVIFVTSAFYVVSPKPIRQNNAYLGVFYARCRSCGDSSEGQFRFVFQQNSGSFSYLKFGNYRVGNQWKMFLVPFVPDRNLAAGDLRMSFLAGFQAQDLEFAGLALVDYGTLSPDDLDTAVTEVSPYYVDLMNQLMTRQGLPRGTYAIGGAESLVMGSKVFGNYENKAEGRDTPVTGQIYTQGFEVNVKEASPLDFNVNVYTLNTRPVVAGRTYLGLFYARSLGGVVNFNYGIQRDGAPFNLETLQSGLLGNEWRAYYLPFVAGQSYGTNLLRVVTFLGLNVARVEVAGFALIDYGNQLSLAQLQASLGAAGGRLAARSELLPELMVYPNPTRGTVNVRLPGTQGWQVLVTDPLGRVVGQARLTGTATLPLGHLVPGLYVLRATDGTRHLNRRVVLEK